MLSISDSNKYYIRLLDLFVRFQHSKNSGHVWTTTNAKPKLEAYVSTATYTSTTARAYIKTQVKNLTRTFR